MFELLTTRNPHRPDAQAWDRFERLKGMVGASREDLIAAGLGLGVLRHYEDIGVLRFTRDMPKRPSRVRTAGTRPGPGYTERSCMTCGSPFWSQGAHNRMCDTCRQL